MHLAVRLLDRHHSRRGASRSTTLSPAWDDLRETHGNVGKPPADGRMRLLILGGTQFLGRAIARHAGAAGHDVTCAARGISGAIADGARFVAVDRDKADGLAALAGEKFDA